MFGAASPGRLLAEPTQTASGASPDWLYAILARLHLVRRTLDLRLLTGCAFARARVRGGGAGV
eukprot:5125486-Pleurochrysis_carterae.AAC.2